MSPAKPYGLCIHSELPLPGCGSFQGPPDVTVSFGSVPDNLEGDKIIKTVCTQECRGRYLLRLPGIAAYHVEEGTRITIAPEPGSTENEWRLFLMGPVWAVLLLQRGLLPIHGCGVVTPGGAMIISGHSGVGKSLFAATLMDNGFPFVSDELCAVRMNGGPELLHGFPQILLWEDSLRLLGKSRENHNHSRPGLLKYAVPVKNSVSGPVPLKKLCILSVSNTSDCSCTHFKGMKKIHALIDSTYRLNHVEAQGLTKEHFMQCSEIAGHIQIMTIEWPSGIYDKERIIRLADEGGGHDQR
jgi:hypothetical protein